MTTEQIDELIAKEGKRRIQKQYEEEMKKQLEEKIRIESKRNISERQDKGEHVELSDIFDEADEIGKMLEETMGTKRFNKALEELEKERTRNE